MMHHGFYTVRIVHSIVPHYGVINICNFIFKKFKMFCICLVYTLEFHQFCNLFLSNQLKFQRFYYCLFQKWKSSVLFLLCVYKEHLFNHVWEVNCAVLLNWNIFIWAFILDLMLTVTFAVCLLEDWNCFFALFTVYLFIYFRSETILGM